MLYSYQQYLILLESKREKQLRSKYIDKLGMDEETFEKFYSNKNAEWLLKTYSNIPEEKKQEIDNKGGRTLPEILLKYAEMFDNNKDNLEIKQISKVKGLDQMKGLLDGLRDFDGAEENFGDDIWVLSNSYEWFIFKAYSYEASELANNKLRDSNWCTTYDKGHWKSYLGPEGGLIYVCNKLDKTEDVALECKKNVTAWDWKDNNTESAYSIDDIIEKVWDEHEEPYNILKQNLDKLVEDLPTIDWDKARENAEYEVRNTELGEIYDRYGSYVVFKHVDDDKFLDDMKDGEYDRYYSDWKYEDNLLDMAINVLRAEFNQWTDRNKQDFFKTFVDEMKEANEENELKKGDQGYYDWESKDLEEVITFLEDTYTNKDGEEIIEKIGMSDEIIEKLVTDYMNNFSDAEDYISNMCGSNFYGRELSNYLSTYHVDMDALAKDICEDMDEEELRNYM